MKTISVKQVATALDITPRAVIYRLEKKALRGTQSPNSFGKPEWRVYPTKEIIEGLKSKSASIEQARKEAPDNNDFDFSPEDIAVAEADVISEGSSEGRKEGNSEAHDEASEPRAWVFENKENVSTVANDLWKELESKYLAKLLEQQTEIGSLQQEIRQRDDQIKLLTTNNAEEEKAEEIKLLTYRNDEQIKLENLLNERDTLEQKRREAEQRARDAEQAAKAEREKLEIIKEAEIEAVKRMAAEAELKRRLATDEVQEKLREEIDRLKTPFWKRLFSGPKA
jgi:hypothetical protein